MTREELNYIKDAFSQIIDDIAGNPDWHEAARAVASDLGTLERKLEDKVSSLPSNLDEAAEEYMQQVKAKFLRTLEHPTAKDAFIAGAEWMAGQGVTKDGLVAVYDNGCLRVYTMILDKEDGIKFGDKVVVQIRKK